MEMYKNVFTFIKNLHFRIHKVFASSQKSPFARCHWHSEISLLMLEVAQQIAAAFKLWIDVTGITFTFTDSHFHLH